MPRPRRSSIGRELAAIRAAFATIDAALGRLVPLLASADASTQSSRTPAKRTLTLSPKRRAALKLQGQYMGYLRNLGPQQKARVKALKATKGYPAAIRLAKTLGRG